MPHYDAREHWTAGELPKLSKFKVCFEIHAASAEEAELLTRTAFDAYFLFEAKQVHFHNQKIPTITVEEVKR